MATQTAAAVVIILACAAGIAYGTVEEYRLYTPRPAESTEIPSTPGEGILVKTITIQRGDTLSALARKFFGRGVFYPEFLPFNEIKNPDLIYAGAKLSVPLAKSTETATPYKPEEKQKAARKATIHTPRKEAKIVRHVITSSSAQAAGKIKTAEAADFEQAVKLYRQGKYKKALIALDGFLKRHPASILAADATLYRGDCYLHLSGL